MKPMVARHHACVCVAAVLWVLSAFGAVKLEYRVATTMLLPLGLFSPAYLLYKAYDLYTVRSEGIARDGMDGYAGKVRANYSRVALIIAPGTVTPARCATARR